MNKYRETSADRLWKEKVDEFASAGDTIVLLSVVAAVLLSGIIVG
jgi:hypothetical protein